MEMNAEGRRLVGTTEFALKMMEIINCPDGLRSGSEERMQMLLLMIAWTACGGNVGGDFQHLPTLDDMPELQRFVDAHASEWADMVKTCRENLVRHETGAAIQ